MEFYEWKRMVLLREVADLDIGLAMVYVMFCPRMQFPFGVQEV